MNNAIKEKKLPNVITVSGFTGTGKSTVAKLLAKQINYKRINVGDMIREIAKKANIDLITFNTQTLHNPKIDAMVDNKTLEHAKEKHVLLEGRLTGWILYKHKIPSLKIWLHAPIKTRAIRIWQREKYSFANAISHTKTRDSLTTKSYKKHYGIDLNDISIYDVVINCEHLKPKQIVNLIIDS